MITTIWILGRRGFVRFGLSLLAYFWLVSCTQPPPDTSYLEGKPCAAPCWQGIAPGVTDEETALKIISDPTLVEQDSIRGGVDSKDSSRSGYIYRLVSGGSGGIGLKDGIVYRIGIRPSHDLTLGKVVSAFGNPDFVHVADSSQERDCYAVDFYYLKKGIWVNAGVCKEPNSTHRHLEKTALVDSAIEVGGLTFFEPKPNLRLALVEGLLFSAESIESIMTYASPWKGFGFYPIEP